jgi:RNA polymerase sigma factor (sigma-70 family)
MDPVKERVIKNLKLAQILAAKYFNIPGATPEEVLSEAHTALVKASMAYQEDKGPFAPFAGTVIRNALNSLYKKQLRHVRMIGKSLDETIGGATRFGTHIGNLGQNIKDTKKDVFKEVGVRERIRKIQAVINELNTNEKFIFKQISLGKSFSEIAEIQHISKQAVFKVWKKTINKVKYELKLVKKDGYYC